MSVIDDLLVKIGVDTGDLDKEVEESQKIFSDGLVKFTAWTAGAGAGLEAFARTQAESNTQTRQMAASLGISEDAMRDLALETANVGFPLNEVLDLMETGKQLGITSGPALREYAEFWDMVGDATGESATTLGEAGVALASMGIEAGNEAAALQAFGFVQEHSTLTIQEFLDVLGRLGPDLAAAGFDVNDTAALLAVLEQEMGMTGRAARTALNEAINQSDGTFQGLIDTLGISQSTLDSYLGKVEESGDIISRNADIQDEEFTVLQKVQNAAQELQYKYGDLATTASQLAPVLIALGPAVGAAKWLIVNARLIVTKGVMLGIRAATLAWTAAQWLLNAAMNANPIGLVVLAVAALIAIFVLLWNKSEAFREFWKGLWDGIKEAAAAVGRWFKDVLWGQWIKGAWDSIVGAGESVLGWFRDLPEKIKGFFVKIGEFIMAPFKGAFNAVAGFWNNTVGKLRWTVPSWVPIIGGNTIGAPLLPTLHSGGIVPGRGDVPIMAEGGEGVFTRDQMAALGGMKSRPLVLRADGTRTAALLLQLLAEGLKGSGLQVVTR